MSCSAIIEEFETACNEIGKDPSRIPIWQPIIANYHPTFIGDCHKAIEWSNEIVSTWLKNNMCSANHKIADNIVKKLSGHSATKSHSRHIDISECKNLGINILEMETIEEDKKDDCDSLRDCILTLHHTYMHTFGNSPALKIVENHIGAAMIIN